MRFGPMMRSQYRGFRSSNALNKKDYYSVLNVPKGTAAGDIKKAYFKLAKEFHPDVNKTEGAKGKFAEINEAYETLGDE
jgi:DnaJ-class molecular chaperone